MSDKSISENELGSTVVGQRLMPSYHKSYSSLGSQSVIRTSLLYTNAYPFSLLFFQM